MNISRNITTGVIVGMLSLCVTAGIALADDNNNQDTSGGADHGQGATLKDALFNNVMPMMHNDNENEGDKNDMEGMGMFGGNGSATPPSMIINPGGMTQIRGAKLASNSSGNLVLSVFGLSINVTTVASSTRFIGVSDASGLAAGDVLSVSGTIDSSSGVVTAMEVNDLSQRQQFINGLWQQIQALLDQIKKIKAQLGGQSNSGGNE